MEKFPNVWWETEIFWNVLRKIIVSILAEFIIFVGKEFLEKIWTFDLTLKTRIFWKYGQNCVKLLKCYSTGQPTKFLIKTEINYPCEKFHKRIFREIIFSELFWYIFVEGLNFWPKFRLFGNNAKSQNFS